MIHIYIPEISDCQDDPDQAAFNYHYRFEECLWDKEIAASINEKETCDEGYEPQNKAEEDHLCIFVHHNHTTETLFILSAEPAAPNHITLLKSLFFSRIDPISMDSKISIVKATSFIQ